MPRSGVADRKSVDALLKSLMLVSRSIEEMLDTRAVVAACGDPLSPSKVRLLKLLLHSGKQTIGQSARFLGVSDPAASQLADALVRQRLLGRSPDPKDRRTAYLSLSATGKKLANSVEREQRLRVRLAIQSAGATRAKEWSSFLRTICKHLASAEKSFEGYCLQCSAHEDNTCVLEGGNGECEFQERSTPKSPRVARTSRARKAVRRTAKKPVRRRSRR